MKRVDCTVLDLLMILLIAVQMLRIALAAIGDQWTRIPDVLTITCLAAAVMLRNQVIRMLVRRP